MISNLDFKTVFYTVMTLLKAIVIIIGLSLALKYFINGIKAKDSRQRGKAFKYFLQACGVVIGLTAFEFLAAYIISNEGG